MGAKLSKKKKGYCLGAGKDGESTETTEVEQKETETLEEQKGAAEPNGEKPPSDQAQNNDVGEKQSDQAKSNGASEKQNDQEGKRSSTEVTSGDKTKDKSNKDQKPESIPTTEQKPIEESKQSQDKAEPLEVAKGKETQESLPVKEQEASDIIQAKQSEAKPAASTMAEKEEVAEPVTKVEAKKTEKSPLLMQKTEQISQQATQEATNTEDFAIPPEKSIKVPDVLEPENVVIETVVQEAVVEPLAQEPMPKPVVEPSVEEPVQVVEPSEQELVPEPVVEPSEQELVPEPVVEPSVHEPVLVVKPPLQKPVPELVVEPPVPELVVEPPETEPVSVMESPETESVSVMEPSATEPVSVVEPPVQEPVPVPVVEPFVCVVETPVPEPESVPVLVVEPPVQEAKEEDLKPEETHLSESVTKSEAVVNEQHAEPVSIVDGVKLETDYESCAKKEEECPSEVPDQSAKIEGNLESALPTVKSAEQIHEQNGLPELLAKDMQVNISTVQEVEDKGEHNEAKEEDNVLDKPSTRQVVEIDSKDTSEVILETSKSDAEQTTFKDSQEIHEAAQDKPENQETPDGIQRNEKESSMQMSNKHGVGNGLPLKEEIKVCLENGSDKDLLELNGQGEGHEIQVCNE